MPLFHSANEDDGGYHAGGRLHETHRIFSQSSRVVLEIVFVETGCEEVIARNFSSGISPNNERGSQAVSRKRTSFLIKWIISIKILFRCYEKWSWRMMDETTKREKWLIIESANTEICE